MQKSVAVSDLRIVAPDAQPQSETPKAAIEPTARAPAVVRAQPVPHKPSLARRFSQGLWWLVRTVLWLAFLAALAYGAWLAALPYVFGPKVTSQPVKRGTVVQTVVASGNVQTPSRVDIGSQATGIVTQVLVDVGTRVEAGQQLATLDKSEALATVEQARAALRQAEVRLTQISEVSLPVAEQSIRLAKANLVNARANLQRVQRLRRQGFATAAQLDEAARALEVAEAQSDSAKMQAAGSREDGSERQAAQAAIDVARANLKAAETRLGYLTITAPATGTIITRTVERGALAQPGKVLFQLAPDGATELVLQIDERNLRHLKIGQAAIVSADAFPAERFEARLVTIDPAVNRERGSIEVKLAVDNPPAYLRQDMTVSVDIEVARIADAITVGMDAVRDQGGDRGWVWRLEDNRVTRQDVTLGVRGGGRVQIVDGLEADDKVVPLTAGALTEGQRVRATLEVEGEGSRRTPR